MRGGDPGRPALPHPGRAPERRWGWKDAGLEGWGFARGAGQTAGVGLSEHHHREQWKPEYS